MVDKQEIEMEQFLEIIEIRQNDKGLCVRVYYVDRPFDCTTEDILILVVHRNNINICNSIAGLISAKRVLTPVEVIEMANIPPDAPEIVEIPDPEEDVVDNWDYWDSCIDGGEPYDEYKEWAAPPGCRLITMDDITIIVRKTELPEIHNNTHN